MALLTSWMAVNPPSIAADKLGSVTGAGSSCTWQRTLEDCDTQAIGCFSTVVAVEIEGIAPLLDGVEVLAGARHTW